MSSDRRGKIQTVQGLVLPQSIGKTLCHEHLFMNAAALKCSALHEDPVVSKLPFQMENVGMIRQYYMSNEDNLVMDDFEAVVKDIESFSGSGGSCIVDCTSHGMHPKLDSVHEVSKKTGIHIVAGTGFYIDAAHSPDFKGSATVESLCGVMRKDMVGELSSRPRCGLIGEVGCSYPITVFERRSLVASAEVQQELGAPLVVHPGRDSRSPAEVARIVLEAGAHPRKVLIAHLDRTFSHLESMLELADFGTCVSVDMFGHENSWFPPNPHFDMPSDGQRIRYVMGLLDGGLGDRLMISHDIGFKHRLSKYGGHGYSHILTNIVPRMLLSGVPPEAVHRILVHNPQQWLTLSK